MAPAADSQPDPTTPAPAPAVRAAPGLWSKLTDNPLLTILGTAIAGLLTILGTVAVGLLIFTLTRTENRISRLEDKVDAGFAAVDARLTAQDAKIDEINLKLTALIAALNATDEIEAALEGGLIAPRHRQVRARSPARRSVAMTRRCLAHTLLLCGRDTSAAPATQ